MPIEADLLAKVPVPLGSCPNCEATPFRPMWRGHVLRTQYWFQIGPKRHYCALICNDCRHIVGYESPPR